MSKTSEEFACAFGYLTLDEFQAIKTLAKMVNANLPTFVNIGAGSGTSTLALAEARSDALLYEVDHSQGGPRGGLENTRNAFHDAGRRMPAQLLGASHEIANQWQDGDIDLIFIDDGHKEPEIRGDIRYWSRHFRHGTIVAFHDYGSNNWPDVKKVVDEEMEGHTKILHVDTVVAFRWRTHD